MTLGEPMVARWGSEHPAAPLVVVVHGNGTSEHSMIEISPWLPHGPVAYAAVRAPRPAARGYTWFTDESELASTVDWLLGWLGGEGDPDRSVLLLAFRTGVTVAGALLLAAPERFSGAVLLHGALPAGDLPAGALRGLPVFLAEATEEEGTDPAARTRHWLRRESGAPVRLARTASAAQLAGEIVGAAGSWLGDRLDHLHAHGENPLPDGPEADWPGLGRLPARVGGPPDTTADLPQLPVACGADLSEALWQRLDTRRWAPAAIGPPGTRSLLADRGPYVDPATRERAHLHPDGSVHVALPAAWAYDAVGKGWAVPHPLAGVRLDAGVVLVPAPRDRRELEIVAALVSR